MFDRKNSEIIRFEHFGDFNGYLDQAEGGFRFLDLGCAPGGFSSFLLSDPRCAGGYGVTLPEEMGGFPLRVQQTETFQLHFTQLLVLRNQKK